MAHVAVTSLLRTVELEFFQSQPRHKIITTANVEDAQLVISLRDKLRSVQSFLDELEVFDSDGRETLPIELGTKLRDFALKAEDEIESELSRIYLEAAEREPTFSKLREALERAVNGIDLINEVVERIKDNNNRAGDDVAGSGKLVTADDVVPEFFLTFDETPEKIMVGKVDEFDVMMDLLVNGASHSLEVVSVHGMGGIGKTVLAKRVYEDNSIKEYFDICAWVVISQHHNKNQMLSRLLKSILQGGEGDNSKTKELQIKQRLHGWRYLIVIDDVWSTKAWDDVRRCFPDDGRGSRVLLTTRLKQVAEYASTDTSKNCHQMRLLDHEESWNLFYEKLPILKESSEVEFETIGKKVVEKCYGLPLAVVVAAGLFWKLEKIDEWKKVEKALDSLETKSIAERCSDILALSYNHLPHYLKSCFLYFGFFPKNYPLIVKKLVMFWIAEGFVKEAGNLRFEQVGENNLHELIDRNLVLVGERQSSYGKIRTCTIHDLLHDLSIKVAQNENLLYIVGERQVEFSPSDYCRWITARKESYSDHSLYAHFNKCRSIIYFEEDKEAVKLMQRGIFKQTLGPRKHISDMFQESPTLKLLRILELSSFECLNELNGLSKWIANLVHLRHLSLIIGFPLKNFSLSKAQNLHTLRISAGYQGMSNPFPIFDLEELPQLRYLKCWPSCELFPPQFVHENLHNISCISPVQCTEQFVAKIPHIKKLSIKGDRRCYSTVYNMNLPNLTLLHELESLSVDFEAFSLQPVYAPRSFLDNIASLRGLKKLKLMCTEFLWKDVNVLADLPKLEVLKLSFQACKGREWKLEEECVFGCLKYLLIDRSSPNEWKATDVNFPKLERLILLGCNNLKEIPSGFADIVALKSIELLDCQSSVVESAEKIKEEQHEYGNNSMVVVVHKRPSHNAGASGLDDEEEAPVEEDD